MPLWSNFNLSLVIVSLTLCIEIFAGHHDCWFDNCRIDCYCCDLCQMLGLRYLHFFRYNCFRQKIRYIVINTLTLLLTIKFVLTYLILIRRLFFLIWHFFNSIPPSPHDICLYFLFIIYLSWNFGNGLRHTIYHSWNFGNGLKNIKRNNVYLNFF